MKIKIDRFLFDTDKFILKVHNGEIYRTKYRSSEVQNNDNFLSISSKLTYKLNTQFILDNLDKLIDEDIVTILAK